MTATEDATKKAAAILCRDNGHTMGEFTKIPFKNYWVAMCSMCCMSCKVDGRDISGRAKDEECPRKIDLE